MSLNIIHCKEIKPVNPKGNQHWIFSGRTVNSLEGCWGSNTWAIWCEELAHWERPWCWERLKAGGEGESREWDGWMASTTQRTWIWIDSRRQWRTGKPGVLQPMRPTKSQTQLNDWTTNSNFNWLHSVQLNGCLMSPILLGTWAL